MVKNLIMLLTAHLLLVSGCVSTKETVEKKEDDKVAVVVETESEKPPPVPAPSKMEERREETIVKEEPAPKPFEEIAVETLSAQGAYTPKEGDTVYVNYYTNFVRYIPLRSTPSNNSKIIKTICIGSELEVIAVKEGWLYVKGAEVFFLGWILPHWVTNDRTVKIDAEKRRRENAPEIARLEAIVKPIPRSKWKDNLRLYEKLLNLDPCNLRYQRKVAYYENYGRRVRQPRKK